MTANDPKRSQGGVVLFLSRYFALTALFRTAILVLCCLLSGLAMGEDINISECDAGAKRPINLSTNTVAVVKTYDGPTAAIMLTRVSKDEVTYSWRYRDKDKGKVTSTTATFRVDPAKRNSPSYNAYMDVGKFVIQWNLAASTLSTLNYCPTHALVEYYGSHDFDQLP